MKKTLTILCIVVMIATLGLSLFACKKNEDFGKVKLREFEPEELTMGLTKPTQDPKVTINENSTPEEVLYAINQNFLNSNYIATFLRGNVSTFVIGQEIEQTVIGDKIRIGKADDANVEFWADNRSYSSMAKVYDETLMTPTKNIYKSAKKKDITYYERNAIKDVEKNGGGMKIIPTFTEPDGTKVAPEVSYHHALDPKYWKVNAFTEEKFDDQASLVERTVNDPRRIWMYDTYQANGQVTEGCILDRDKVQLQKIEGQDKYKLSINFDLNKVTANYENVLQYMLEAGAGKTSNLRFVGLRFDIVLWDNGYISDLYINEQYAFKVVLVGDAGINTQVTLTSRQQYSYDPNDSSQDVKFLMEKYNAAKAW